jgi:hypothetical protein
MEKGMNRLIFLPLVISLAWIGAGRAGAAETRCDIVVQSQAGGQIEVLSDWPIAGAPQPAPRITWRPLASSPRAQVWISYQNGALTGLGEPTGVHFSFRIPEKTAADGATLFVKSANGRTWRFVAQGLERGSDTVAYVEFGDDLVYGRALLGALADGQDLSVAVERYDAVSASTVFAAADLRARDALLVQARRKFEAADPTMCQTR